MDIQYICEFATLARLRNFQKAAKEMNISQATLTRHIKNLETELGILLFERTTRRVFLTEEGKRFMPYAIAIRDLHGKFVSDLNSQLADYEKSK